MAKNWDNAPKDPDDVRDYGIDWTNDIGDNTIDTSTWTVVSGTITILEDTHDDKTTAVRLAGGIAGQKAVITNHVILSNGEEADQSGTIMIKEK